MYNTQKNLKQHQSVRPSVLIEYTSEYTDDDDTAHDYTEY